MACHVDRPEWITLTQVETLNLWCSRLEPPAPKGHPAQADQEDDARNDPGQMSASH